MADLPSTRLPQDPRALVNCLFDRAKRWWRATVLIKIGTVALGAVIVLAFPNFKLAAVLIFFLYICSELTSWRGDYFKGTAEGILRRLDFFNSFAWPISGPEMSNLIVECPSRIRRKIPTQKDDEYFASKEDPGPRRAMDNLQESAFWTKHLAKKMGHVTLSTMTALVIASLITLLISVSSVKDLNVLSSIGRIVTSALMLILSLGLTQLTYAYYRYSKKAEQSETEAIRLLGSNCDKLEAVKAWHEYHIARAAGPLIPTRLWQMMNESINAAWETYRVGNPARQEMSSNSS